jgi:nucleotide-binding universal stress UspA family protein
MGQILVGVDGSKESRDALRCAAQIARATHSRLVIASAVEPVLPSNAPEMSSRIELSTARAREEAHAVVKELAASIGPGLDVETLVPNGNPAAALAGLACAVEVDMVVVGHRGRNAVARALLGSVADRLVQISPKPVLVVR